MATPKKKVSRSRRNMRRFSAAYQLETVTTTTCSACGDAVRPHRVCRCGSYKGKTVIEVPAQVAAN